MLEEIPSTGFGRTPANALGAPKVLKFAEVR